MKKDLHMGYRKAKLIPITCNDERSLVLRQQYALRMLALFQSGRRIINIDESWLNQSRFIRKVWVPSKAQATFTDKQIEPRISLITAFDTNGKLWWALTQANTDTNVMSMFINQLVRLLDLDQPGWEEESVILLDNVT